MQTKQGRDTSTMAFRISIPKRRLIEAAAAQRGLLVSHWLREVALESAREEMQKEEDGTNPTDSSQDSV